MGHGGGRRERGVASARRPPAARRRRPAPRPPPARSIYKVGWTRQPDNLNPFVGYDAPSFEIWYLTYDSLVGYDPKTLSPMKGENSTGLATDWTISADGLTWTFTLRQNAKWSDGVPLTAKDVAFTYNYVDQERDGEPHRLHATSSRRRRRSTTTRWSSSARSPSRT